MNWKQERLSGNLYKGNDEDNKYVDAKGDLLFKYNNTKTTNHKKRDKLIRQILGSVGKDVFVASPFFCDFGCNITMGNGVFLNYNVTILDDAQVFIGDNVLIAPNVGIYTALHLLDPQRRKDQWQLAKPVHIEDNA